MKATLHTWTCSKDPSHSVSITDDGKPDSPHFARFLADAKEIRAAQGCSVRICKNAPVTYSTSEHEIEKKGPRR